MWLRVRKFFVVVFILLVLLTLALAYGWRLLRVPERLRDVLLTQLRPVLGATLHITHLKLDFQGLQLKDVRFESPDGRYDLRVEEVHLGYSLARALKEGFNPRRTLTSILFVHPRLLISAKTSEGGLKRRANTRRSPGAEAYRRGLQDFDRLEQITVSRGEIVYQDSLSRETLLAREVNGAVNSKHWGHAAFTLAGKLFTSPDVNLVLQGALDLAAGRLKDLYLDLRHFRVTDGLPFFVPPYVEFLGGTLDGKIHIVERETSRSPSTPPFAEVRDFGLSGTIRLREGALRIADERLLIEHINVDSDVDDWNLHIRRASQVFNGSPVELHGTIRNFLRPDFDLTIASRRFDLGEFLTRVGPKAFGREKSSGSFRMRLQGPYTNPRVSGWVRSERVALRGMQVREVAARFALRDSVIFIEELRGSWSENRFRGTGVLDLAEPDPTVVLSIDTEGSLLREARALGLTHLAALWDSAKIEVTGSLEHPRLSALFTLAGQGPAGATVKLQGQLQYADEAVHITATGPGPSGPPFHLDGRVTQLSGSPGFDVTLKNFGGSLFALTPLSLPEAVTQKLSLNLRGNGDATRLRFEGKSFWAKESGERRQFLQLAADLVHAASGVRTVSGTLSLLTPSGQILPARLLAVGRGATWEIKTLEVGGFLKGWGRISPETLQGEVAITEGDFSRWAHLIGSASDDAITGQLSGRMVFAGAGQALRVGGEFALREAFFHGIGPCTADFVFQASPQRVTLQTLRIDYQGTPWMRGSGLYEPRRREGHFTFQADSVSMGEFVQSLTGKSNLLNGTARYSLSLDGKEEGLALEGQVRMRRGSLKGFGFDEVSFRLRDPRFDVLEVVNPEEGQPPSLQVEDFSFVGREGYRVRGRGLLPYSRAQEFDVALEADGDVLSVLPRLGSLFKEAHGRGKLEVHLAGPWNDPALVGGHLRVSEGVLKLEEVAKKIENLEVQVELDSESRFIHIAQIAGTIGGEPFTIRNAVSVEGKSHRPLEPLVISEDGLSLGVISLETSPKGVPLNIPEVMAKGDIGYVELVGREEGEKFYIAGPAERPVVRGAVNLRQGTIAYPAELETEPEEDNWVIQLLRSIDWNVKVTSIQDNRYVRKIPATIDHVYVDLQMDDHVSALDFNGVYREGTFTIAGNIATTQGTVEYLDLDFQVERAGAEWDKSDLYPIIYGRAKTTITDSTGFPSEIYLTVYMIDPVTQREYERGRWGVAQFRLSSDNPNIGRSNADILQALGYTVENIKEKATDVFGITTDNLIFRPLFRPFERGVERTLGLDIVRINSRLAKNFLDLNLNDKTDPKLYILRSTRWMLGKYLAHNIFLVYSGQVEVGTDYRFQEKGMGLRHTVGLEYRVYPNLLLEMQYDYDSLLLLQKEDKRIRIRQSFPF